MNRRNYLKLSLSAGLVGAASFSVFKYAHHEVVFTADNLRAREALITALAERIIPKTDTPGASEAAVSGYIINVLLNCTDQKQQVRFLTGLEDVDVYSRDKFGATFVDCSNDNQDLIITYFEKKTGYTYAILNKIYNKLFGKEFYTKLRELTIEGYCLSQVGATRSLVYDPVPGSYQACIPMKEHQKSWATK